MEEEDDPITGIENIAIRVLDRAPDQLRSGALTGARIGRGLGLTADLVARHEGSLQVEHRSSEQEEGWAKALVLRLRRLEVQDSATLAPRAGIEESEG